MLAIIVAQKTLTIFNQKYNSKYRFKKNMLFKNGIILLQQ